MKNLKIYMVAMAALILTACSDSGYWEEASLDTPNYTFEAAKQSYSFAGDPQPFTIYVTRGGDISAAAEVPVTVTSPTTEISGAPTISFPAGSSKASYQVNIGNGLECGENNVVKITIDGEVKDWNKKSTELTVYREYTFRPLGEGMIQSPEGLEYEWPVDVEVANEDPHVFRIPDPYYVMYDDESSAGLGTWQFEVSADYTKAAFSNFYPGFYLSGYEIRFILTALGTIDGDSITFPIAWYAYDDGDLAGSFGTFPETIVMPAGWKK